jgi:hypothetical protein
MSSPRPLVLQQLDRLDGSSSRFHDQLSNVLYGEEYMKCVPNLQGDDLARLVDYLGRVRRRSAFSSLRLSQRRLSTPSTLPVPVPENVYANLDTYVAPG